jgi:hypothetical protein
MSDDLPESILTRAEQLAELHRSHPTTEMTDAAHLMTEMLHIAVHGDTWARPETPQRVWLDLLGEVAARRPGPGTPPLAIHVTTPDGPRAQGIRDEYIRQAWRLGRPLGARTFHTSHVECDTNTIDATSGLHVYLRKRWLPAPLPCSRHETQSTRNA